MDSAINPTLHTAAMAGLEQAINAALSLDPRGSEQLAALDGCVFALHCTAPVIDVYLLPGSDGIDLRGIYEGEVTTSVRGSADDFIELATSTDPTATLINGALELAGDSAPLIELQKAVAGLDLDWEAPLVDTLGDVVGHQLAQVLRGAFSWSRLAGSSLSRQLDEFIHEEARLTPPRLELEDFYTDVQELSLRVDRLESRTQRLRRRLEKMRA